MSEVISLMEQRLKVATEKLRNLGYDLFVEPSQTVIKASGANEATAILIARETKLLLSFALDSYSEDVAEISLAATSSGPVGLGQPFFFDGKDTHFGEEAYEAAMLDELQREEEQKRAIIAELEEERKEMIAEVRREKRNDEHLS